MTAFLGYGKNKPPEKKIFKAPLNTAVFTTKFVTEDRSLITYVSHDEEDGSWQFLSNDEFHDFQEVAKLVSLGTIIDLDATVLDISEMPEGYQATRTSLNDVWQIFKTGE